MTQDFTDRRLGGCLFEETPAAAPELSASSSDGLPQRIDLRGMCSPIEDQGHIGSCAANAVVGAMEYHQRLKGRGVTDLSRLFLYYNARKLADKEQQDSGTFIHHAMAAVLAWGVCPEAMWPYQRAMWSTKPADSCYRAALEFEAVSYARAPLGPACKQALAMGLPVVFGAVIPGSMLQVEAREVGRMSVPTDAWPAPGGGHAMLIVGYDDAEGTWIVRNSWGLEWGDEGHGYVPYEVMDRYGIPTQFWVIGEIEPSASVSLRGASLEESQAAVAGHVTDGLDRFRGGVREKLEQDLEEAKEGFRSRLRGPGAGGGY